jgi:hypothetical protein
VSGVTLDTGALKALARTALDGGVGLAVPAGVRAQAWRASARQARLAQLLRSSVTVVVALDRRKALAVGQLCAQTGASDIVNISVVVCAREHGHSIITSDPDNLHAIDPAAVLRRPD